MKKIGLAEIVSLAASIVGSFDLNDEHKIAERQYWRCEIRLSVLSLAISILTLIGAATGVMVASRAYNETTTQTAIAKKSLIENVRAYVTSTSVRLVTYGGYATDNGALRWVASPVIENSGNSPTKNLRYSSDLAIGPRATDEFFAGLDQGTPAFSSALIGPKSEVTGFVMTFAPDVIEQLSQHTAFLSVRGVVKYQDIFDGYHLTEFCYSAPGLPISYKDFPKGQPIRLSVWSCPHHNCADEECGADWEDRARR